VTPPAELPAVATAPRAAGRPRDPELDTAILEATRALLVEVGYQGLTMQGVARRAGVFVPAIYRRWASKAELVEAAVLPFDAAPLEVTGAVQQDLRSAVTAVLRRFADPALRAAVPGLISEYHQDPAGRARVGARSAAFEGSLLAIVGPAVTSGDLPSTAVDQVPLLAAIIVGSALSLEVTSETTPIDDALLDALTGFLLRGLGWRA
jgi:AcrR family transcriptional regulator